MLTVMTPSACPVSTGASPIGIREKLERQPPLRIVDPVRHRQTELDEREQQTSLGDLEAVPRGAVRRIGEIGDHPRDSA